MKILNDIAYNYIELNFNRISIQLKLIQFNFFKITTKIKSFVMGNLVKKILHMVFLSPIQFDQSVILNKSF